MLSSTIAFAIITILAIVVGILVRVIHELETRVDALETKCSNICERNCNARSVS